MKRSQTRILSEKGGGAESENQIWVKVGLKRYVWEVVSTAKPPVPQWGQVVNAIPEPVVEAGEDHLLVVLRVSA